MKKAISVFAIAFLFISLMSPIVRADITLTSEFVEPVKNWSFEDRDMPVPYTPNDGVYRVPPWETNKPIGPEGGWRDLRGDINGDGTVNIIDKWIMNANWGPLFTPENPDYDPNADINGDGVVNIVDKWIMNADWGKTANRIDGSYSWYTSGGGDYQMWQGLDSDTINAVKGKQVTFAFWFLPESVAPDGSQNKADAAIEYWYDGQQRQQQGSWVYPEEIKWHHVFVSVTLPETTTLVRVWIYGQPDFKAWIDQASLSIYTTAMESVNWDLFDTAGTVTVSANIFQLYEKTPQPPPGFPDSVAYLAVGIGVERHATGFWDAVCIRGIELDVKLLTDDYLTIYYSEQSNDEDIEVDPEAQEEFQNQVLMGAGVAISAGIGFATFLLPVAPPLKPVISVTSGFFGTLILQSFASEADIGSADDVGDYVRERWWYGNLWKFANGRYGLTLEFFKGSVAEIEVTARVYWGLGGPPFGPEPFGTTEVSTIVTVSL